MKYKVGDKVILEGQVDDINDKYSLNVGVKFKNNTIIYFEDKYLSKNVLSKNNKTYEDGLADAWELVRNLYDFTCDELEDIYKVQGGFYGVISKYAIQEAIAKLEAYEESKSIKVGDVVYANGVQGVVIDIISDDDCYIYDENGCIEVVKFEKINKTGRTVDIEHLLEQIRGDE